MATVSILPTLWYLCIILIGKICCLARPPKAEGLLFELSTSMANAQGYATNLALTNEFYRKNEGLVNSQSFKYGQRTITTTNLKDSAYLLSDLSKKYEKIFRPCLPSLLVFVQRILQLALVM